tara:strand:+ start:553 stop:765 length:213 start_codon:yes stop_codon:yes gene_type:complete
MTKANKEYSLVSAFDEVQTADELSELILKIERERDVIKSLFRAIEGTKLTAKERASLAAYVLEYLQQKER